MLFNSFGFLVFFPTVTLVFFAIPQRYRVPLLLLASYFFYMCWAPGYIILIIISTLVDYLCSLKMGGLEGRKARRPYLIASIVMNLALLFVFKYFHFFSASLAGLLELAGFHWRPPALQVLLPIGISFYTFQTMSYTIDVYRGERDPERRPLIFALYVAFFPQLVAGPIERSNRLLPQFHQEQSFDYERVTSGLRLMLWGFFQKCVIADRAATLVEAVYSHPDRYQGPALAAATVLFSFQIYCDFSGYSDIAIGAGRVMGFKLMNNFNRPYHADSVAEFWRRWHISLSTWFRDYVYIPLGGSRVAASRHYFNLIVVFALSGLWHGANWTFVVWGLWHGVCVTVGLMTRGPRQRLLTAVGLQRAPRLLGAAKILVTFALVCFAWIFFRSRDLSDAFYIIAHLLSGWGQALAAPGLLSLIGPERRFDFIIVAAFLPALEAIQWALARPGAVAGFLRLPIYVRWAAYYALLMAIVLFGRFDDNQFIYFQF